MTLWGGRFREKLDPRAWALNASISFDHRLGQQDVRGSLAWARGLRRAGVLSAEECAALSAGLEAIGRELAEARFAFQPDDEDIHSAVERRLRELVGPAAGKLHTGRSRNDQVATDFRLWVMESIPQVDAALAEFQRTLLEQMFLFKEAMIMNHRAGCIPLSILFLYFFLGSLCAASFVGCAGTNIIPASKIPNGKVTISWNNVPGAISYNIYFSRTAGVTQWNVYKIPSASNPITVIDLDFGKTYYFAITVVDKVGESSILSEKSFMVTDKDGFINFGDLPQGGQKLEGQAAKEQVPEGQATLLWDNVANSISYNIYLSSVWRREGGRFQSSSPGPRKVSW